nr:hypothetical protein [Tanacetum cinerariifolium]
LETATCSKQKELNIDVRYQFQLNKRTIPFTPDVILHPFRRVNVSFTPDSVKATSVRLTNRKHIHVADRTQRTIGSDVYREKKPATQQAEPARGYQCSFDEQTTRTHSRKAVHPRFEPIFERLLTSEGWKEVSLNDSMCHYDESIDDEDDVYDNSSLDVR